MSKLTVGSSIPLFQLNDQKGNIFNIKDILGNKSLVIYFYPKDETVVCTKEACSFRDSYEIFIENEAEVIGISADSTESHKKFAQHHSLPFTLLSDPDNKVRNLFGVPRNMFGFLPGRVTYIIDKKGIIRHIFNSQMDSQQHVDVALEILKQL
jgi:peroxiredoxin Q/BCP